jgi:predicted phosphoribosyltransferase
LRSEKGIIRQEAGPIMSADQRSDEPYSDRRQAGIELADELRGRFTDRSDVVVLALPRGGVPVAYEVARALRAPLDIFLVRKLGLPGHPELAMGAIASGGVRVLNQDVVSWYGVTESAIEEVARIEQAELERREQAYRETRAPVPLQGRVVILVDDGLATGSTMRAAVRAVGAYWPSRIVVAVPVGAVTTCREFAKVADEIVCPRTPEYFTAVGEWYRDFSQTTDDEVRAFLQGTSQSIPSE